MIPYTFTFGEVFTSGELAYAPHPTDETAIEVAAALGAPPGPWPAFATVPVLLQGQQIGVLDKIQFVHGETCYRFLSCSGNTHLSSSNKESVLQQLEKVLGFTSPKGATHDTHPDQSRWRACR
jgi:hypothetical protein